MDARQPAGSPSAAEAGHARDVAGARTALLLALPGLATLAVSLPAGAAADRLGARRVTLCAGALLCLSSLATAVPSVVVLLRGASTSGSPSASSGRPA